MAGRWHLQNAFTGGEISPRLFGRIDLKQYANSVAYLLNCILHPHGGVTRRPGTKFVCEVADSNHATRLIPFESGSRSYVIEAAEHQFRFIKAGALVLDHAGTATFTLAHTYTTAEIPNLRFAQMNDVLWITHPAHPPAKLSLGTADHHWTLADVSFIDGPYDLVNTTTTTLTFSAATGDATVTASAATFAATDVGRCVRVYNATGSPAVNRWAWGKVKTFTSATSVVVTHGGGAIAFPTSATAIWKLGKFSGTTGYPALVTFHEGRCVYAGCASFPQSIDLSTTDVFDDFSVSSPLVDSDACSFTLAADKASTARWMISSSELFIGSSDSEWTLSGGGNDTPISPTTVKATRRSTIGSSSIRPMHVGNVALFVNRTAKSVHEMAYIYEQNSYGAPDLCLLAEHIFRGKTIVDIDHQRYPDSLVWCVLSDGTMATLTYMRDQEVVGWGRHTTTGGLFEAVTSIMEGARDVPYFVVKRGTKRYIEYLADSWDGVDIEDSYHVDHGVTVVNSPASVTVAGLTHLNGVAVQVLADGKVVTGKTPAAGAITLDTAASLIHVGIGFNSDVQTLPLEDAQGDDLGTSMGRMKLVNRAALKLSDTVGCQVGPDILTLSDVIFNEDQTYGAALTPFTGEKVASIDGGHGTDRRIYIRQTLPLPFTVNAIVTEYSVTQR